MGSDVPARQGQRFLETAYRAACAVPEEYDALQAATWLRKRETPETARAAAELRALQTRATRKLGREGLVATRKGLEQATPRDVATERATRILERMGETIVLDATCGLGADALALAAAGHRVVAADLDPWIALHARWNLQRCEPRAHAIVADAAHPAVRADVLVLDPDRRAGSGGRRSLDPHAWSPPWSICRTLVERFRGACLKLAPAFDVDSVEALNVPHSWSWTSLDGELVETTLWTGELASGGKGLEHEAIALRSNGSARQSRHAVPVTVPALDADELEQVAFVVEPDPAWIRAGLVGATARELGFAPLGSEIAYLGGTTEPASGPWRRWRVLASEKVDRKRLRALLREHDIGRLVVHKRGHPLGADELARRFAGSGSRGGELIVSRTDAGHVALLVERL